MFSTPKDDLMERLENPEYAKLYGEEHAKVDFAITLTKARKSLRLTQRGLSERLGISQPYIAKLEGGEANPTLGTIGRLLAIIGLRLVTGTAPLRPEARPPLGLSVDATDAANEPEAWPAVSQQGISWQRFPRVYADVGIASEHPQSELAEYRSKEPVAGGV